MCTSYRAIEIISHNRDFLLQGVSIYTPSPIYLYLLINLNSSRVLENDEVYSSSIDKYDRSFIYIPPLWNGLLNYVNFNG